MFNRDLIEMILAKSKLLSKVEFWIVYWNTQESKRTKTSGSVVSLAIIYFSVGICVDFCAHIVHGFLTEHGSRGRVSSLNSNMNEFVCVSRKESPSYYGACGTGCYEWWVACASKTTKGCCLDNNFYLKLRLIPKDISKQNLQLKSFRRLLNHACLVSLGHIPVTHLHFLLQGEK